MPDIKVLIKIDNIDKQIAPQEDPEDTRPMKKEPDSFPEDFEVEDAYVTLIKAYKIKQNKSMVNKILEYAKSVDFKINSIADLKDRYSQLTRESLATGAESDDMEEEDD